MIEEMEVRLFEHENFVWLDHGAVVEALNHRRPASCDPMVVYNNLLRWSLYQLDRNACVEIDEQTGNDIPIQERLNWIRRSVHDPLPLWCPKEAYLVIRQLLVVFKASIYLEIEHLALNI